MEKHIAFKDLAEPAKREKAKNKLLKGLAAARKAGALTNKARADEDGGRFLFIDREGRELAAATGAALALIRSDQYALAIFEPGPNKRRNGQDDSEHLLGLPPLLTDMYTRAWYLMPAKMSAKWPERFFAAIPPGADLSTVTYRASVWLMSSDLSPVGEFSGCRGIGYAIAVCNARARGDQVPKGEVDFARGACQAILDEGLPKNKRRAVEAAQDLADRNVMRGLSWIYEPEEHRAMLGDFADALIAIIEATALTRAREEDV